MHEFHIVTGGAHGDRQRAPGHPQFHRFFDGEPVGVAAVVLSAEPQHGMAHRQPPHRLTAVRAREGLLNSTASLAQGETGMGKRNGMRKVRHVRLTEPLVWDTGQLRSASWDEALNRAAAGFARHRGGLFGMFSCSKATNEVNYTA
jgi:hypothetical protein